MPSTPLRPENGSISEDLRTSGPLEATALLNRKIQRIADHDSFESFGRSIAAAAVMEAHKLVRTVGLHAVKLADLRATILVEITDDSILHGAPIIGKHAEPGLRVTVDMPGGPIYVNV